MSLNESQWVSMSLNESQWVSMNLNESQWVSISLNESQWVSMRLIETHWDLLRLNKTHWETLRQINADCLSQLDWPWKTAPKWLFECPNSSTVSKDTVIFVWKLADLYSHRRLFLMTGLALKSFLKMNLWMSKPGHCMQRNCDIYFEVSWFAQP